MGDAMSSFRRRVGWMLCLLVGFARLGVAQESDFVSLFDGETLKDWDGDPQFWRVDDGVIVGETTADHPATQNTFLIYRGGEFADFELRFSYRVDGYNSGVQYRSVDRGNWSVAGYQCDFEDRWHRPKGDPDAAVTDDFSGMLFDEQGRSFLGHRGEFVIARAHPMDAKKSLIENVASVGDARELESHIRRDDWNELIVIARGFQFTHIINGHVMAVGIDEDESKRKASGIFAFQLHRGPPMKIQLKDIRVRSLGASLKETTKVDPRSYQQFALRHAGNPANGKQLFADADRTKCVVCHKVAGQGGDVGVDLSAIGSKFDRPHLIESLLEPSRQIVEGYRTANVLLNDGNVISGIVKKQTEGTIELADASGRMHRVLRDEIDGLTQSDVSIMPTGLANELSIHEFTDLIAYLETLRGNGKRKPGGTVSGPIELPDEFEVQTVVTGIDGATALDVLPDGRVLVCEQTGCVRVIENGKLIDEPVVTLPVDSHWERGVIGVTHDPGFPTRPFVYVCWVGRQPYPHHRISRFRMEGNVAVPASEKVLLVGDDQTKLGGKVPAGHQGGALHFGNDAKLYVGIGEQTAGEPSQRLDTLQGKILRINADGSIPADNPFVNQTKGKYQSIWARGARNPFTFAIRNSDGLMLINDVGGEQEEINVGRAGANYGWPTVEHGDLPEYRKPDFDGPIHWYKQASINGGDFCSQDSAWPQPWRGRYFFADYVNGWIHTLNPDDASDVTTFANGIRRPVDLRFAPDGTLYVLLRNAWVIDDKFQGGTGSLLRIRPRKSPPSPSERIEVAVTSNRPSAAARPGELYREYAIHNGGNFDWRVTDPRASAEGAKKFLPNPVLRLRVDDLRHAVRAEAVLDRWGGHAGTKHKLIRFNGQEPIRLPELTTTPSGSIPERFYSQDNPIVNVPLEDLREGENIIEGMIGPENEIDWGQWGLYSLILRVYYDPAVKKHAAGKIVSPRPGDSLPENPTIQFKCEPEATQVDVMAWYDGYDEDGNGIFAEWHAARFQPSRGEAAELRDHVGTVMSAKGELTWQTKWIPDQSPESVKLVAHIHDADGFVYVTDIVDRLSLTRDGWSVTQYRAIDVPEQFGVRVGQKKSCRIRINQSHDLARATEAILHYRTWEASDKHHEPFLLNGNPHLNEGNNHHYDYDQIPIPVRELTSGDNTFSIHSKTEHHMLEVLWPGPALTVRYQTE
tara:strand:- start:101455 stop:105051 length:3597 start_codon:yes stop_codon:yes gene_type:complete